MGCLFSYPAFKSKSIDDYASFINNDTMELLLKNDESIFNENEEISQYELNKLVVNRLITLENNIEELSKDVHHLNESIENKDTN
tara:strand:+ start:277 stop:531 length:255 start_codon:yes stop_codon:yes gene_type:complete